MTRSIVSAGSVALVGLSLAGCMTRADMDAAEDRRFRSFIGLTMAQFAEKTALVPSNFYPTEGGRTFVVDTPSCRILLNTAIVGKTSTPDSFKITSTVRRGGCLYV